MSARNDEEEKGVDGEGIFDAVVVGGGPAGLTAALYLGRVRRRVLLCDAGEPRNAPAEGVHGFLSRDGTPPSELLEVSRGQLSPYDTVEVRDARVVDAERKEAGFEAALEGGGRIRCRKLVLATGVEDVLPEIGGVEEFWGRGFYHCPYCHGFEHRGEPLAVHGGSGGALHMAMMLARLTDDVVFLTDGADGLDEADRAKLSALGVGIEEGKVERLEGRDGALERVVFEGGRSNERRGVFGQPAQRQRSDLAERLGCGFTEDGAVRVEADGSTGIPGLHVAGDAMRGPHLQQVLSAAVSGAVAAVSITNQLLVEDLGRKLGGGGAPRRG